MGNDLACRLPSIDLLSLDLPLPLTQYYPVYYDPRANFVPRHTMELVLPPPTLGGGSFAPQRYGTAANFVKAEPVAPSIAVGTGAVKPVIPALQPSAPSAPLASYALLHAPAPSGLTSLVAAAGAKVESSPDRLQVSSAQGVTSGLSSGSISGPDAVSAASLSVSLPTSLRLLEVARLLALSTPGSPKSPEPHKDWKPRKKRQCPECHLYFSNLATHKSTHLKPTSRPHVCKLCHRGFARPNDLFRHFKCHWKEMGTDNGQFRCPFKDGPHGDHCCHSLGIFSRCDTYKNHLKAIHFQYPSGTKKNQRNLVPGSCRLCQAQFRNVDEWINTHIDTHQCPFGHK